MYADDANIIITADSEYEAFQALDKLGEILVNWVNSNGLFLNLKKTNYMLFSRSNRSTISNHTVIISNTVIERKSEARLLGVIVDAKLNWSSHIASIRA